MAEVYGETTTSSSVGAPYMFNPTFTTSGLVQAPDAPRQIEDATTRPKARGISIQETDHGYMVHVGCQSFAIESRHRLMALLSEYLESPEATEKKHREGKLFV